MSKHSIVHGRSILRQVGPLILLGLLMLVLVGCQTTGPAGGPRQAEVRADALSGEGRHADAARIYIALAGDASGDERIRLTILAVEEWLRAGDMTRARTAFAAVGRPIDADLRVDWALTAARLDLAAGDAESALETLQGLDVSGLSLDQRLRLDGLRGAALFDTGEPLEALNLLFRREMWLEDAAAIMENHRIIWAGLIASDLGDLEAALDQTTDPTMRGWLTLGMVGAGSGDDPRAFRAGVADWRRSNPGHPALTDLLPSLLGTDAGIGIVEYPRQIAVLLPLSGRSSSAGMAIRDGIIGAYFQDYREGGKPLIRLYDVTSLGTAFAYQSAIDEGAEFVIGPLLKPSVMEVVTATGVGVPTLALNTLPDGVTPPAGLYQFALAPEDEAIQVGERVVLDGRPRGVALVPGSQWGDRVLTAFAQSLEAAGGRLLDYRQYDAGAADFSDPIESLLLLDESVTRYRRLRSLVAEPLQFEPRRRGDIDFIFLGADGATARLLRPQLRFHYAGGIPVYATSAVNERDGRSDSDLNGITFPEIPWIVSERPDIEDVRQLYATLWRGSDRFARLYAMGYDAYRLVGEFQSPGGALLEPMASMTGELTMDPLGRIHRRLPFASFEGGEVVAIPEPEAETDEGLDVLPGSEVLLRELDSSPESAPWRVPARND